MPGPSSGGGGDPLDPGSTPRLPLPRAPGASGVRWRHVGGGSPERVDHDDNYTLGVFDRSLIIIWKAEMTAEALKRIEERTLAQAKKTGQKLVYFQVMEAEARLPAADVRALSAAVLRFSPIRLSALVFEGIGFQAAAVRAFMTWVGIEARARWPHRSFGSVVEATDWIEGQTANDEAGVVGSLTLARAIRHLRK